MEDILPKKKKPIKYKILFSYFTNSLGVCKNKKEEQPK